METKKLQTQELQQIKALQEKSQSLVIELGQIELIKISLEERTQNAKAFLKEVKEEEKTLAEFLEEIYGKGSVDLDKGEFVPFEQ